MISKTLKLVAPFLFAALLCLVYVLLFPVPQELYSVDSSAMLILFCTSMGNSSLIYLPGYFPKWLQGLYVVASLAVPVLAVYWLGFPAPRGIKIAFGVQLLGTIFMLLFVIYYWKSGQMAASGKFPVDADNDPGNPHT